MAWNLLTCIVQCTWMKNSLILSGMWYDCLLLIADFVYSWLCTLSSVQLCLLFFVIFHYFMFLIVCGRLSWLSVSFWLCVKIWQRSYCNECCYEIFLMRAIQRFSTARYCSEKIARQKNSSMSLLEIEFICHVYMWVNKPFESCYMRSILFKLLFVSWHYVISVCTPSGACQKRRRRYLIRDSRHQCHCCQR